MTLPRVKSSSRRTGTIAFVLLAILGATPGPCWPAAAGVDVTTPEDAIVVTDHTIDVGDRRIDYRAHAGKLPIYHNDTGELIARMFVMAYVAERRRGEAVRPLTFIWNGGPGASSSQLQLVGFGPRGVDNPPTYPEWQAEPPTAIVDHPETWLSVSDLVFVDPIGTGYSRATTEKYRDLLFSYRGDVEAVAEMIRVFRTRFDAWDQPLFIAGESYGTTRAMGVAEALERRRAGLAGVVLMSGSYDAGQEVPDWLRAALNVPMYTAAAHYHGRLPEDLQAMSADAAAGAAEDWARSDYAPSLRDIDSLSAGERRAVTDGLARFTGIDAARIGELALEIDKNTFADELLADRGLELGRYDLRMTGPKRPSGRAWVPTRDPSLAPMLDLMQGTFPPAIRYLRDALGYRSDLLYQGPFGEAFHPWPLTDVTEGAAGDLAGIFTDWMTIRWDHERSSAGTGNEPPARPPLARAMERNPSLLVWNVKGLYDGSCAALDEAVARTPEPLRRRIRNSCYPGGHMIYSDDTVRARMVDDFARFVRDARAMQDAGYATMEAR